ncbi:MAG: decarboxylating NADP(+)-dependent phosphogluconate dehydrogenase [Kiritimatiellae bacterium]|jgi:6-phosphogluconate dehydrogenase|nr:decarboxylating NADP(+)-dependent phosphogluconate dehydrogenase [Kiritimatiellia bacterium]MDD2346911.1 decarboxylating NADP(+)-dependent phosphogluconate dehydrogenase [Kiritimatiellia bacterium]MDD3584429.1 decarboxylating NADP(+)-dependent phosphogluconate dehydrogenase [Kiritimatiellia bacterium]HHU13944.1 decarboxylating NADP(+)-dependent phosphogluconate dehydrogenase [Lentisphaerota bacterium]
MAKKVTKADIGLIGLAVMGENLILNMESKGYTVACYNRTVEKVDAFINGRGAGKRLIGCRSMQELADSLKKPRRVMIMVKAGAPVDQTIEALLPVLEKGDIIIDGGNSHFPDTIRRTRYLAEKGLRFIGAGVSGGEEGALLGPAIMPGGDVKAWPHVKSIFQDVAAKVEDGTPCCAWIGSDGAGHFVKMVHNGIEYGDMQLICEAYDLMARGLGMSAAEMQKVFAKWNAGDLDSYLIEITADILSQTDAETGKPIVDIILDTAGQKGTGKWTSQAGLDLGVAIPQIAEAVFARYLSAVKDERVAASKLLKGPAKKIDVDKKLFIKQLEQAVYASKICSYAQGYQLLRAAAEEYKWDLNYGEIALVWRQGCIIRARFLGKIKEAFDADPKLANLLLDPYFKKTVAKAQSAWRAVIKTAIDLGIPVPAMGTALNYFDSYRSARLPANLLQAQRDYFGAHTFERVDKPRGEFYHHIWTESGGSTAASTYTA